MKKFYLFDVKNPIEITLGLEKPKFEERGPYAYKEILQKVFFNFIPFDLFFLIVLYQKGYLKISNYLNFKFYFCSK